MEEASYCLLHIEYIEVLGWKDARSNLSRDDTTYRRKPLYEITERRSGSLIEKSYSGHHIWKSYGLVFYPSLAIRPFITNRSG